MSLAEAEHPLTLAFVSVNDLPHVWDQVGPLLERACAFSSGAMTPESVVAGMGAIDGVERFKMLALVSGRRVQSIMVVCLSDTPSGKRVLELLLVGGEDVQSWMPFEQEMDEFARSFGCQSVRIPMGRKGWLRHLAHWKLTGFVLERAIDV